MNQQERQLVDDLFERLSKLETAPRDPGATAAIADGLRRAPNAVYALVQTVLVQDEALRQAHARIEALESEARAGQPQGGFLDNMRGALFGQQTAASGSVPSVRPADTPRPAWNTGQVAADPRFQPQPAPMAAPPHGGMFGGGGGGGGSFLGTAAAAAAGMIGGSLLLNSFRGMMGGGGNQHGFGDQSAMGGGDRAAPWGGDQSQGGLARDAGLNDIGRGGNDRHADADGSRQGAYEQASNDSFDDDDDGFDSSDDGDSDLA